MTQRAAGTLDVKTWDEKVYEELGNRAKLARASVTQSFHGDIVGEGSLELVLLHREDGTSAFTGLQRVLGRLGDRAGSFILHVQGALDGKIWSGRWSVIPHSATAELRGLTGDGDFPVHHGLKIPITLDYSLG
jgi:hypothetical protein